MIRKYLHRDTDDLLIDIKCELLKWNEYRAFNVVRGHCPSEDCECVPKEYIKDLDFSKLIERIDEVLE